ncbi:hypothetical protein ACTXMH_12260 [Psychrobacter celer]|uniref:hypothetical protein n=2 Tax=Psychrobacter TaxID=497 RepID=UPI004035F93F
MDICSWNWGAIGSMVSTLIPSAVALYIFSKWKHQKKHEVLSNEAANVLIAIQDYREKIIKLHSLIMNIEDNSPHKKEVKSLKKATHKLRDSSFLFSELITEKDNLVLKKIAETGTKFYYEARDLGKITKQELITNSEAECLVDRFDTEIAAPKKFVNAYYLYKHKS